MRTRRTHEGPRRAVSPSNEPGVKLITSSHFFQLGDQLGRGHDVLLGVIVVDVAAVIRQSVRHSVFSFAKRTDTMRRLSETLSLQGSFKCDATLTGQFRKVSRRDKHQLRRSGHLLEELLVYSRHCNKSRENERS